MYRRQRPGGHGPPILVFNGNMVLIREVTLPFGEVLVATRGWEEDEDLEWLNIDRERLKLWNLAFISTFTEADGMDMEAKYLKLSGPVSVSSESQRGCTITRWLRVTAIKFSMVTATGKLLELYEQGFRARGAVQMVREG